MIILFEENERNFNSLGLGILKDAISCPVKESLNDQFILSLSYPIKGQYYSKIKIGRIIYCKSNPFDNSYQPFRITSITKPINGIITVEAVHVSYDMNGFPVKPISGLNLNDILYKIVYGEDTEDKKHIKYSLIDDMPFTFNTNIYDSRSFKTTAPYNMRAILMGGDESLIKKFNAELVFDKFNIKLLDKRGADRGAKIIYGKNMTDINNVSDNTKLFNGVYPYYHSESTSSETISSGEFKKAYIVGTKEFQDGWLSYSKNGEPFHPITDSPIQIASEGEYYEKVYCWNETSQRFEEKKYNQSVMLIQDVLEPEWVTIDWSHFPTVVCKARKKGYFKKSTDEDWGPLKGVGDTVFESSILNSGIMENIMLSYSEVIPSTSDAENESVEEIIHVELDEPILWIDTLETRQMKHDNILSLDLTSEFDEEPTQQQLKNKAEEYISKNKIGISKDNITVSFIDLSKTTEGKKYEKFDHIELGDTVHIIYEELGVNTTLRVISTEYDAVLDRYDNIELGEKQDEMSSQVVQSGDNVSSLTNDAGYADVTTVNKLIAKTITAEWIEAVNAKLSKAAISQLQAERIECKGIIEASQFTLDTLVAKLLIAENAQIAKTLEAGNIKVAGNIDIKSGSITINGVDAENQNETYFIVDRNGNVVANSVTITGGELNIGDGNFTVSNSGEMVANMAYIRGTIEATSGLIGGMTIEENGISSKKGFNYIYVGTEGIKAGSEHVDEITGDIHYDFEVDPNGNVIARQLKLLGGEIKLEEEKPSLPGNIKKSFSVNASGEMKMNSGNICLGIVDKTLDYNLYLRYSNNIYKANYLGFIDREINGSIIRRGIWHMHILREINEPENKKVSFDAELSVYVISENSDSMPLLIYSDLENETIEIFKAGTYVSELNDIDSTVPSEGKINIGSILTLLNIYAPTLPDEYFKFEVSDQDDYSMNIRDGEIKLGYTPARSGVYKLQTNMCIGLYKGDFSYQGGSDETIYTGQRNINGIIYGVWETIAKNWPKSYTKNLYINNGEIIGDVNNPELYHIIDDSDPDNPIMEKDEYLEDLYISNPIPYKQYVSVDLLYMGNILINGTEYGMWRNTNMTENISENGILVSNAYVVNDELNVNDLQNIKIYAYYSSIINNIDYLYSYPFDFIIHSFIVEQTNNESKDYMFHVDRNGLLKAKNANIEGTIKASAGYIGGWLIKDGTLESGEQHSDNYALLSPNDLQNGIDIAGSGERTDWRIILGKNFGITKNGDLYSSSGKICGLVMKKDALTFDEDDETSRDFTIFGKYNYTIVNNKIDQQDSSLYDPDALEYVYRRGLKTSMVWPTNEFYFPFNESLDSSTAREIYYFTKDKFIYHRHIPNAPTSSYTYNTHTQTIEIFKETYKNMVCVEKSCIDNEDTKIIYEEGKPVIRSGIEIYSKIREISNSTGWKTITYYNNSSSFSNKFAEIRPRILSVNVNPIYDTGTVSYYNIPIKITRDSSGKDILQIYYDSRLNTTKFSITVIYYDIKGYYNEPYIK